ncbi:DeoR/GlpR family DNA-binding transcription regulator [Roseobacter litoralis]|uniref:DeoR/GlpR family DNA-binding transcription regulator n=1 Tax=Roseobacter litoralis TaxID=42443 RepID=UPI0024937B09|nr:DeoR/GlpR family DNA-binding transcription regulator [Roseobacter litoralis]
MTQNFRHADILNIAHREGKVTVDDLADRFGVTLQTIRRDLTELAADNKLERVHGGAVLPSGTTNIEYDERRRLNAYAKTSIARACAACIDDGSSVFLNIGTTTEAVAQHLLHHQNLMVVTNNMNVAGIMGHNTSSQTIVTGGALRRSDGGLIGHVAVETIRHFKFDVAVIGCSALDVSGDLLDFDVEEVSVSRAIIAQSRKCYLVADHSKLSRSAPVRIASLRSLTGVFTDAPFPPALAQSCDDWGVETVLTG